ncbi:MAG: hypothetical protein NTV68_07945 [Methanomicrobiales archaeon]|nr:hypothetical protein [Methanomicrobiales archaeon]
MTKFEDECKDQSQWERDLGMWEYTTMPSGLIIPTYERDEGPECPGSKPGL